MSESAGAQAVSKEVSARRNALFERYVKPYQPMIFKLCAQYSFRRDDVQDNYVEVLTNLYRYIETYDTSRPVITWLHIVTKRCVFGLDKRRKMADDLRDAGGDPYMFPDTDSVSDNYRAVTSDNYQEYYSDDILSALEQLKPQYRRAFLLQQEGYKLREIAEIEYMNGSLSSKNIDTIKSRVFLARQQLQQLLTRDGKRRTEEV